jgi:hypothetical protein
VLFYTLLATAIIYIPQWIDFQEFIWKQIFALLLSAAFAALIFMREVRPMMKRGKTAAKKNL